MLDWIFDWWVLFIIAAVGFFWWETRLSR